MTTNIASNGQMPAPLATDATVAERPVGPCSICQRGILRAERYGLTYPAGHLAHVACVARMATPTARTHGRTNPPAGGTS